MADHGGGGEHSAGQAETETLRGLSLAQTGQMMALYSVVTLSLELPTGGLADAWGRRPVIVASAVLQALSLLLLGVLGSVPFIMLAMVLMGTSRALSSGPVEAWYVDAMHGLGHEDVESGLAHGQIAESLALGGAAVIGGLLPRAASGLPSGRFHFLGFLPRQAAHARAMLEEQLLLFSRGA